MSTISSDLQCLGKYRSQLVRLEGQDVGTSRKSIVADIGCQLTRSPYGAGQRLTSRHICHNGLRFPDWDHHAGDHSTWSLFQSRMKPRFAVDMTSPRTEAKYRRYFYGSSVNRLFNPGSARPYYINVSYPEKSAGPLSPCANRFCILSGAKRPNAAREAADELTKLLGSAIFALELHDTCIPTNQTSLIPPTVFLTSMFTSMFMTQSTPPSKPMR